MENERGYRADGICISNLFVWNVHLDRIRRIQERRWKAEDMRRSMPARMNAELVRPGPKIFVFMIRHQTSEIPNKYICTSRTEESQLTCFFFYNFEIGTHKSSPVRSTASPPRGKPSSATPLGQERIPMDCSVQILVSDFKTTK